MEQQDNNSDEWKYVCSDALLKGQKICQAPFYKNGSYICEACATSCRSEDKEYKQTDQYFFPYQCQCQFIDDEGECFFKDRIQEPLNREDEKLRTLLIKGLEEEIEKKTNIEVKPNPVEQQRFMEKIQIQCKKVLEYEDELVQSMGQSLIPEEIQAIKEQVPQLKALLKWFKQDFFTWCDKPICQNCNTNSHAISTGVEQPTQVEKSEGDASRVETYKCQQCQASLRFPRFNNPVKLMETRTGRCGEWANCFTALCRALGHESRYVLDWTDHVWTECFINETQRWTHLDSCENAFDTPLIYEGGWGKKLTYIIAFSKDEVVDVSKRYILNKMMNRMRRTLVPESWLQGVISEKRQSMWKVSSQERQNVLSIRFAREQESFNIDNKSISTDENIPRQSGSLEWRVSRGELGDKSIETCVTDPIAKQQVVSKPKELTEEQKAQQKEKLQVNIKKMFQQYTIGCGKVDCQNFDYCASSNPALKSKEKTEALQISLKTVIDGSYKLCD